MNNFSIKKTWIHYMQQEEVRRKVVFRFAKSSSTWHHYVKTWPFYTHFTPNTAKTTVSAHCLLQTRVNPGQIVCVTLYMIEWLLVKSKLLVLLNMYLHQSMAPVYATRFLFMFIHTLINSATAVSAVSLISILCEAPSLQVRDVCKASTAFHFTERLSVG